MKMYINGRPASASNGESIEVLNPATNEVIDTVPSATKEDVESAISVAVAGEKAWAAVPLHKRMAMMQNFIDLVMEEENHKRLAMMQCLEMGKPYKESYNDFSGFKAHIEGFISAARNNLTGIVIPFGVQTGMENDFDVSIREPIGTIVGIIPFNAPLTLFAKKVAARIKRETACRKVAVVVLGLEVPHAHIHLIPMNSENDVDFHREKLQLTPEEFREIAEKLSRE
mgnify:CR=1 FL=1